MHSWIKIDQHALLANYRAIQKTIKPSILAPVLKSNAYGHGMEIVYEILAKEKPSFICVNYVFEGALLRSLGYQGKIIVVGPITPEDIGKAKASDCALHIGDMPNLQEWAQMPNPPDLHLKIDTGLSRQGFLPKDISAAISIVSQTKAGLAGICTHFANVEDVLEQDFALEQLNKFNDISRLENIQAHQPLHHCAASSAALILPTSRRDLCRIGIALYGFWPSALTRLSFKQQQGKLIDLKPVLSWYTKIMSLKEITKGAYVSYGCTFKASQNMRLAVLPVGYFEGIPRSLGEANSYVLIQGTRCRIVGRICMNISLVDVSHLPNVRIGEIVTLIGKSGTESLRAEDWAQWTGTIHYEIVTNINPIIPITLATGHALSN